jgi:putative transposase
MAKRRASGFLISKLHLGERRSCRIVGLSRSMAQYRPVARDDDAVIARKRMLASEPLRYGCPRLHAILPR